jgi:hypothetical protein
METLSVDSAYEFNFNYSQEYQTVLLGELASQGLASMELTSRNIDNSMSFAIRKVLELFMIH